MNHDIGSRSASLDIVLLHTFLAVMDAGGFAQAAERLSLTPSAVSGHIKRLEDVAGTRVLHRTTRRVQPTEAGEILYSYARHIVNLEREALARLKGDPVQGRIRVGASEDFAGTWLPKVLGTFQQLHPEASIELKVGITAELLRQQARGRIDVIFGKQCKFVEDGGDLLWEESLIWAYAERAEISADCVIPLAAFPEPCIYRESAVTALTATARSWRLVFESNSMAGCLSAALAGFAVTPIARSQMRHGLRELGLSEGMPTLPNVRFYAFVRKSSAATTALIRSVRDLGRKEKFLLVSTR